MTAITNKRSLEEASIEQLNPSKKRKLNEENENDSSPVTSESTNPSVTNSDDTDMSPPTHNPAINNVNVDKPEKNDLDKKNNDKNDNTAKPSKSSDDATENWSFKASNFTFGDNSWVRQSSNGSIDDQQKNGETLDNANTMDSFSEFAGLGFKKVLDEEDQKEDKEENGNKKEAKDGDNKAEDQWGGAWSNSNPDGTFKLNFDWGNWESSNAKIDLNPSTKIGWESQAPKYDPNIIEQSDKTKEILKQMTGEQDSGDREDKILCSIHCKVYNLESGKYVERGKGIVNINKYKINNTEKARILCRRDQILTTIINAPILKEMKFEKVGNFIRFGVVEQKQNVDTNDNDDNTDNTKKEEDDNDDDDDDDDDINAEIKTFLIKPIGDKSQSDTILNKIKEIQEQII